MRSRTRPLTACVNHDHDAHDESAGRLARRSRHVAVVVVVRLKITKRLHFVHSTHCPTDCPTGPI